MRRERTLAITAATENAGDAVIAPMPGRIVRQLTAAGDRVSRGAPLLVLEAMKMEHTIVAPGDGRVAALRYAEGDQVEEGVVLLDFEGAETEPARVADRVQTLRDGQLVDGESLRGEAAPRKTTVAAPG